MKIGILRTGAAGLKLAEGFHALGHEVMLGTRDVKKHQVMHFLEQHQLRALAGSFADAAKFGEIIVVTVAGRVVKDMIALAGAENFKGKTVIDTTNPISQEPAVNGVLKYFTGPNESLGEMLQQWLPDAHVVKCFNSVGNVFMIDGSLFGDVTPTMFICGNDEAAKRQVTEILDAFHWETLDCGKIEASRAIEPLCMLWCIPGFLHNQWRHAFKLVRSRRQHDLIPQYNDKSGDKMMSRCIC